ncbi:Ankyrin repeat domain 29 [Balamuthia mandrillaris]
MFNSLSSLWNDLGLFSPPGSPRAAQSDRLPETGSSSGSTSSDSSLPPMRRWISARELAPKTLRDIESKYRSLELDKFDKLEKWANTTQSRLATTTATSKHNRKQKKRAALEEMFFVAVEEGDLVQAGSFLKGGVNPNARRKDGGPHLASGEERRGRGESSAAIAPRASLPFKKKMAVNKENKEEANHQAEKDDDEEEDDGDEEDEEDAIEENGKKGELGNDERGETALYVAAARGDLDMVNLLLGGGAGASCNLPIGEEGMTPLLIAASKGYLDVVKALVKNVVGSSSEDKGKKEQKRQQKSYECNVNVALNDGRTAIFLASMNGHSDIVRFLIESGADPNKTTDGLTPLYMACYKGHYEAVQALLEHKEVDVNARACDGSTALFVAARKGHTEVVSLLISKGADVNMVTQDGRSALFAACQYGHVNVVKTLLEGGADKNFAANEGATPLYIANLSGHNNIVKLLLSPAGMEEIFMTQDGELKEVGLDYGEGEEEEASDDDEDDDALVAQLQVENEEEFTKKVQNLVSTMCISSPTNVKKQQVLPENISVLVEQMKIQVEESRIRRLKAFIRSDITLKKLYRRAKTSLIYYSRDPRDTSASASVSTLNKNANPMDKNRKLLQTYKELYLRYKNVYDPLFANDEKAIQYIEPETLTDDYEWLEARVKEAFAKAQELREQIRPLYEIRALLVRELRPILGTRDFTMVTFESKTEAELLSLFGTRQRIQVFKELVEKSHEEKFAAKKKEILTKIEGQLRSLRQKQQGVSDNGAFCEDILKRCADASIEKMTRLVNTHGPMAAERKNELRQIVKKELEEELGIVTSSDDDEEPAAAEVKKVGAGKNAVRERKKNNTTGVTTTTKEKSEAMAARREKELQEERSQRLQHSQSRERVLQAMKNRKELSVRERKQTEDEEGQERDKIDLTNAPPASQPAVTYARSDTGGIVWERRRQRKPMLTREQNQSRRMAKIIARRTSEAHAQPLVTK